MEIIIRRPGRVRTITELGNDIVDIITSAPRRADQMTDKKYWMGTVGETDDFEDAYEDVMIDGQTKRGPWACMTPESWAKHGVGRLGTFSGQKYQKQADGRWLKVEG